MGAASFLLIGAGVVVMLCGVFSGSASAGDPTVISFEALAFKLSLVLIGGFLFAPGVVLGGIAALRKSAAAPVTDEAPPKPLPAVTYKALF